MKHFISTGQSSELSPKFLHKIKLFFVSNVSMLYYVKLFKLHKFMQQKKNKEPLIPLEEFDDY